MRLQMTAKHYSVWITFFGQSALNVGIIGANQSARSSWVGGKLEYIPINDGSQEHYEFEAKDDDRAWFELNRLFSERHNGNKRPISGRSYLRQCRKTIVSSDVSVCTGGASLPEKEG